MAAKRTDGGLNRQISFTNLHSKCFCFLLLKREEGIVPLLANRGTIQLPFFIALFFSVENCNNTLLMIFAFVYGIRHCVSPLSLVRSGLALIALWGLRSGLALFALWPYKDSLPHWLVNL